MDMKYRAVIFDLDGTLLDTLQDLAHAVNKSLEILGYPPHPVEAIKYFIGDGREALALRALPENHRDENTFKKMIELINLEYEKCWEDHTAPYPGIPELLDDLVQRDVKLAILSNKPQDFTSKAVSKLLSRWRFKVVLGAIPAIPRKPDPAGAVLIARELKIDPSAFIYLGDSDIDMKTARAAGMYAAGALWGFRTREELEAAGAQRLVAHPLEVLDLL